MDKVSVIIPAAGLGTRMRPLSNGLSKTLIPLNGKPILAWILDELSDIDGIRADIDEIVIVTNSSGDIRQFLDTVYKDTKLHSKIKTVIQDRKKYPGPGGAIITAMDQVISYGGANVLVWLGDTVCLYPDYDFGTSFLGIAQVPSTTAPRWCIPVLENGKLEFLNKPDSTFETDTVNALIGLYYMRNFSIDWTKYMEPRDSEIEISELILDWKSKKNLSIELLDETEYWYDCGELDSFYESKAKLLGVFCREQSGLTVNPYYGAVSKYSNTESGIAKLNDEYEWYIKRTGGQKLFIPKIIDHDENSYTMDICPGSTLADILIYENVPKKVFASLVERAISIYHHFFINYFDTLISKSLFYETAVNNYSNVVNAFYRERALSRLYKHEDLYKSLLKDYDILIQHQFIDRLCSDLIKDYANKVEHGTPENMIRTDRGYDIHGDFHLGNILFDSMTGKYTFLDPRGGKMYSDFADTYYDMAKLYHDIYCGYFLIVKGIYTIKDNQVIFSDYYQEIMNFLVERLDKYLESRYNYNCELIKKLAIMQMLTCVPFHLDNPERCKGFITRSLNLINKSKKE